MVGKILFTAFIGAAGMAIATASPALADTRDDVFIGVIEGEGIPFSTPADTIALAYAVCDYVSAGQAPEQVAVEIAEPANWTVEQSGFFVGAATQTYCPA